MRFLSRSLTGLFLVALTLGLLGLALASLRGGGDEAPRGRRPGGGERAFTVTVATLTPEKVRPEMIAYGVVESARSLELRAGAAGTLEELAPVFRDGARVRAGEVLYRIDPAPFETRLALAESDLDAARAEEAEAAVGLDLAREEVAAAERQRDLRETARARAQDLRGRGVNTKADLESADLAAASAEQALTGRRLALAQAEARIKRAAIARRRAEIARDEAARDLEDTVERAPFDGVLTEVDAVAGRLVSANERLGLLIDPGALEVAFRVSNAEFARLGDGAGGVLDLEVQAGLTVEGVELSVPGRLVRAGVSVASGQTGRLVYAQLEAQAPGLFRPGDFLTVRVREPALDEVAVVPATALGAGDAILLVGADGRLESVTARVLRRQGDDVILADVPFGRDVVTRRLPQLGAGVKVDPVRPAAPGAAPREPDMVVLTPERRALLIERVEGNARMPADVKARLLAALDGETVPRAMVERLEAGGRGG